MKISCLFLLFLTTYLSESVHANYRLKRQLGGYRFPGPRLTDDYVSASRTSRALVKREPQYEDEPYSRPASSPYRSPPATPYQPEPSGYPSRPYAPSSSSYPRDNKKNNYDAESSSPLKREEDEPEEERKPSKLEQMLAQSKFVCSDKKDGYYADTGLGCQIFHYCVQGAKHSWMCPEQTVFHQVHLNCVPAAQDICAQSEKFFVVNDYLHKEIDQRGPNNTVRYHQRYYPEEFLGDAALNLPTSFGYPPEQSAPPAARQSSPSGSAAYSQPRPRPAYNDEVDQDTPIPYNNYRPQSYPPAASRDQTYSSYQAPTVASRQNTYAPASAPAYSPTSNYGPRKPTPSSYSPSYPALAAPSYTTPAPTSYRPISSGLRYAQSSGSPIRSYPSASVRPTVTPYNSYPAFSTPAAPAVVPHVNRQPTQSPSLYHNSPNSVYKKASIGSAPVARYPYTLSSYPVSGSQSSPSSVSSSSARDNYPGIAASPYESGFSRFNAAFLGSDFPSRYRTGVTYENDY